MMEPSLDERAFERMFRLHYAEVTAFVRRRVTPSSVDDVVAETFMIAWRRIDRVPSNAKPWLFSVARNIIATRRRGDARRKALLEKLRTSRVRVQDQKTQIAQPSSLVVEALSQLGERDREVIVLVAWEDLTPKEAAIVIGISAASFRVRLHRAKKRLRDELQRLGVVPEVLSLDLPDSEGELYENKKKARV